MKLSDSLRVKTGVFLAVFGVIGVVLILIGGGITAHENGEKNEKTGASDLSVCTGYSEILEKKVEELVEKVCGERPAVLLTLDCSGESVYAENLKSDSTYSADGKVSSSSAEREYLIMSGDGGDEGLLLREICPKIRGIAVVCRGGDSPNVKLEISELLSVAFGISKSKVSISGTADG